ncbi:ankyrin [Pandoraea terrigena]|uniref:Ankyrin n=2 Tax=Pandoraea terrigena TaxID=2508292 RepID=A0A5E4XTI8_9BURK|nr:ankyrin [Pandoraea terrigena]
MTLGRLLDAKRHAQCTPEQAWEILMNLNTTAGRELRDSCLIGGASRPEEMAFSMATLFCMSAQERSLAKLDDAGIFIDRTRREQLCPEDAALLLSDEGLQLWLRFAASPSAYLNVFVDSILNAPAPTEPTGTLAAALRVLVASGRDTTNDVAASEVPGNVHAPLSHVCSQVAPEWLPSLLRFGADANQRTASGVPLVATALAAQAQRLYLEGHDLLVPHVSFRQLGATLQSHGADLSLRSRTGSPPVMLLALNGYCAAAEALLSLGACCLNADRNGNTLMHYLAAVTHLRQHAVSAFFLLNLALRFGGNPDEPNREGTTPRALLRDGLAQYLRLNQTMIAQTRERARRGVSAATPPSAPNADRHVPPFVAALAAEAHRLNAQGHDPLLPHESLFQLGMSFQRDGADLAQPHADGTLPVLWLARQGYCGAAEVLLALHPNANVGGPGGNTLMHALAGATRMRESAILADYMLTTALRYGGDPTRPNRSGDTALSFLSAERTRFVRASFAFVTETRNSAQQKATQRR